MASPSGTLNPVGWNLSLDEEDWPLAPAPVLSLRPRLRTTRDRRQAWDGGRASLRLSMAPEAGKNVSRDSPRPQERLNVILANRTVLARLTLTWHPLEQVSNNLFQQKYSL